MICVTTECHTGRRSLQPPVDLRQSCCEQIIEHRGDGVGQRYAPACRFRLYSEQDNFAGRASEQIKRVQQVAESEQVHALARRQVQEFLTREAGQSTWGRAEIHRIDGEKMRWPFEARQQIEPERTAFNRFHPGGKPTARKQYAYCVHADAIIRAHQVAETEYGYLGTSFRLHRLARAWDTPVPACFFSSRLLCTNFHPLKMLSIRPFFCPIDTSTAL